MNQNKIKKVLVIVSNLLIVSFGEKGRCLTLTPHLKKIYYLTKICVIIAKLIYEALVKGLDIYYPI